MITHSIWDDVLLLFSTAAFIGAMSLAWYGVKYTFNCRHKWGKWDYNETESTYMQARTCEKCGYAEMEQWAKLK